MLTVSPLLGDESSMMDTNIELIRLAIKLVMDPSVSARMAEVAKKAFAELDVFSAAQKAVVSGAGAIAQGKGAAAAGEGSIAVGGNVSGKYNIKITGAQGVAIGDNAQVENILFAFAADDVSTQGGAFIGRDHVQGDKITSVAGRDITVPLSTAFDTIAHSTASVLHQLEEIYTQTREQAQGWFRFSLIAAGIGFILIGSGVVVAVFGQVTAGLIASLSSAVPNVVAALFFLQSKAANERVDAIQKKLTEAREVHTAVEIANSIETKRERDRLKAEIVRKVIGFANEPTKPA